ncbi:Bro-N domain-containing protein [Candidatus Woesearchaeota archaeon]|nr:Bro-N domain-containing protein [Candidatus Woesearchaeota archaeon]
MDKDKALVVFQDKKIRRIWHNDEWYFSVTDIVQALTESLSPRQYWGVLKSREPQLLTICLQLKMPAEDGRMRLTDCVNTKDAFRLIQSWKKAKIKRQSISSRFWKN